MEIEKNKRIEFLDIARGIAIILMVCGHADGIGNIEKAVNLFNMALFMFISGYLFDSKKITTLKSLNNTIIKRVKKLYIYYVFYELFYLCLKNTFFNIGFYSSNVLYGTKFIYPISSVKEFFISIIKILLGMGREPFCGAFWFIISLIFVIIIYSIISYISNKFNCSKMKFLLVLMTFIFGCTLYYFDINIPRFAPAFTMTIIFYIGEVCRNNIEKINFKNNILFLISTILLIILYHFGAIAMNSNSITNPIYFLICSISGIYFCMFISKQIENVPNCNKHMSFIGSHTISIMGLHFLGFKIVQLCEIFFGKISYSDLALLRIPNYNLIWYILYVLCGIYFPLICYKLFNYIITNIRRRLKI